MAAVVMSMTAAAPVRGAQAPPGAVHLLAVPYLPQSELLCGGAAVAMVMRYWGATGVYAESFSTLVDRKAGGIHGEDLLNALHARGWQAVSVTGNRALVQQRVANGQPVIVLIQDRPGQFHYVVIVGWGGGHVVVHDPARAPFRVIDEQAFSSAWQASGYWTLLASPSSGTNQRGDSVRASNQDPRGMEPPSTPVPNAASGSEPCGGLVSEGIRLAGIGDADGARQTLQFAAESCPGIAAPWRELAGVDALRNDWSAAAEHARHAVTLDPADHYAWRILATALYVQKNDEGALAAWNHVREPTLDLVTVTGLVRTRYGIVTRAAGLEPDSLLTPGELRAAQRRLADLPSARVARVTYTPGEDARAQVNAVVIERPMFPTAPPDLAAAGLHALTDRALNLRIASPTGGGEVWSGTWRWWTHRPMAALAFSAPAPFGGTWGVRLLNETQTYGDQAQDLALEEQRVAATVHVGNWTNRGLRWQADGGVEHWRGVGRAVSSGFSLEQRLDGDRTALFARVGGWRGAVNTWTIGAGAEWRSRTRHEGRVFVARAGFDAVGVAAPLAAWPGAGTGQGRDALLRAHPLLEDGVIRGEDLGRELTSAGAELRQWSFTAFKLIRIAPTAFIDSARISDRFAGRDARWLLDAGLGLRIAVPGAGLLRIDVAHGLRDGASALSVGWTR